MRTINGPGKSSLVPDMLPILASLLVQLPYARSKYRWEPYHTTPMQQIKALRCQRPTLHAFRPAAHTSACMELSGTRCFETSVICSLFLVPPLLGVRQSPLSFPLHESSLLRFVCKEHSYTQACSTIIFRTPFNLFDSLCHYCVLVCGGFFWCTRT